jgi:hypothetical protein
MSYNEGDIYLAISDIQSKRIRSEKRAAKIYNIPQTTIQRRRARQRARSDCEPNSKRLTKLEEEVILQSILNASLRRLPPTKALVRDIANRLLRERGRKPISKH